MLEKQDEELRFRVIEAIEASKMPELFEILPRLARSSKGASRYGEVMKRISESGGFTSRSTVCEMRDGNRKVVAAEPISKD